MAEALAKVGHNSGDVTSILRENPAELFASPTMLDDLLEELDADLDAFEPDLTTKKGRDAIASLAADISRLKVPIDEAGKDLNSDHNDAIKKVNAVRKRMRDSLDKRRDRARKPLTDWENAEAQRIDKMKNVVEVTGRIHSQAPGFTKTEQCVEAREALAGLLITEEIFQDRYSVAETDFIDATRMVEEAEVRIGKAVAEHAELEKLRAEKAEREQKEREAAEAKAREEAAAKAKAKAEAAEAQRIKDAEARAAREAQEAAEREAQEKIKAAELEAATAKAELERQEKERQAEADRIAAEAKRKADEDAARQADQEHRSSVIQAATEALMNHAGLTERNAKAAVLAIQSGNVPNITIEF